jgi:hypothetical protein
LPRESADPESTAGEHKAAPRATRLTTALVIAGNLTPAALLFWLVHRFGVDLPFWDEWELLNTVIQRRQGQLNFHNLFAPHNEHRIVFPRLITLANASLFHWNRKLEMYAAAALLTFSAFIFFRLARRHWKHASAPLLFIPLAWTLLSWRQWENVLLGMGTVFALATTGAVCTFYLLHRARRVDRFLWGAAAAAFIASFSSGGGLLLWPVGLAQLLLQRACGGREDRTRAGALTMWTGAGVFTFILYFLNYSEVKQPWPTGLSFLIAHPMALGRFVATMIGSPLTWYQPMAQSLGFLIVLLGAWVVWKCCRSASELMAAAPLLAMLAFILLTALVAADYRLGIGVPQALSSRYTSLTALGLAALYVLVTGFALTRRRPADLIACGALGAFLTAGALTNFVCWREDGGVQSRLDTIARGMWAVRYADVASDEALAPVYIYTDHIRNGVRFLKANGYSLFHENAPGAPPDRSPSRLTPKDTGSAR